MEKQMELAPFMERLIGDMKDGKRLKFRSSCKVSDGYMTNLQSALVRLREFEKVSGRMYLLDDVGMSFRREFVGFLVRKGLKPNTIKTRMSSIHVVMREAVDRGMTENRDFDDPDFVPLQEPVDSVYLTEKQLEELKSLKIDQFEGKVCGIRLCPRTIKTLEMTRDLFLMGCMTGQRFSDYSRIESRMTVNTGVYKFVKLKQKKTGVEVLIPVKEQMVEIMERYDGVMPRVNLSTFNRNMRILGKMMGWTWRMDWMRSGKRFCDMLSSHTARRSFATNAYQRGVPLKSIMAVTGHRSERSLRIYLKLDSREKALMAARDFAGFLKMRAAR